MSISLLSLLVGNDGPATIDINLSSLGFGIYIYLEFCVSTALLFVGTSEFLVIRKSCKFWGYNLLRSLFLF